jgi:hypothetical protein
MKCESTPVPPYIQLAIAENLERGRQEALAERRLRERYVYGVMHGVIYGVAITVVALLIHIWWKS